MRTFIKDECGVTAVEYGIFTSLTFAIVTVIYGSAIVKINAAFDVLVASLV